MRIRQVRPEFWQDEEVATWSEGMRLFYIGLWACCDDEGFFEYVPSRIAALLYPYESRKRRETKVAAWLLRLIEKHKVIRYTQCVHAVVPSLKVHQRSGGVPSVTVKKVHDVELRSTTDNPVSNVKERYVEVRGGAGGDAAPPNGSARGVKETLGEFRDVIRRTG